MNFTALFLRLILVIALVLIMGPILTVVILAFSSGATLAFPPPGLSLKWFAAFFALEEMRNAFLLSLGLALASAFGSCLLGVMAALYAVRRGGTLGAIVQGLAMAPLVFPALILGLALLILYRTIGVPVLPGLFVAHVVVCLPYAFRSVLTSLQSFDMQLEEAAAALGAPPLRTFYRITLPIIWPGLLSGFIFAFVVSFGELNTALFLTGPGITTLPIEIFSYLQFQGNQLVVAAASALQILVILVLLVIAERLIGSRGIVGR
jgi:putative spermidine/putrescine transport system permease protein